MSLQRDHKKQELHVMSNVRIIFPNGKSFELNLPQKLKMKNLKELIKNMVCLHQLNGPYVQKFIGLKVYQKDSKNQEQELQEKYRRQNQLKKSEISLLNYFLTNKDIPLGLIFNKITTIRPQYQVIQSLETLPISQFKNNDPIDIKTKRKLQTLQQKIKNKLSKMIPFEIISRNLNIQDQKLTSCIIKSFQQDKYYRLYLYSKQKIQSFDELNRLVMVKDIFTKIQLPYNQSLCQAFQTQHYFVQVFEYRPTVSYLKFIQQIDQRDDFKCLQQLESKLEMLEMHIMNCQVYIIKKIWQRYQIGEMDVFCMDHQGNLYVNSEKVIIEILRNQKENFFNKKNSKNPRKKCQNTKNIQYNSCITRVRNKFFEEYLSQNHHAIKSIKKQKQYFDYFFKIFTSQTQLWSETIPEPIMFLQTQIKNLYQKINPKYKDFFMFIQNVKYLYLPEQDFNFTQKSTQKKPIKKSKRNSVSINQFHIQQAKTKPKSQIKSKVSNRNKTVAKQVKDKRKAKSDIKIQRSASTIQKSKQKKRKMNKWQKNHFIM